MKLNLRYIIYLFVIIIAALSTILFTNSFNKLDKPNIIVILVDTLRADHLGAYGYERNTSPNVDEFANDSLVFNRAIAPSSWTVPSVASLLSGLYPSSHTTQPVRDRAKAMKLGSHFPSEISSLPEILKQSGYKTVGVSSNPWISSTFNFDQGFDKFHYFERAPATTIVKSATKVLTEFKNNSSQPWFLYLHFFDPHSPYDPPDQFKDMFSGNLKRFNYSQMALDKINLYDGEISFFDQQFGLLLQHLKQQDLYEDTLIVFVSDHGEAFHEHGHGGHGYHLYVEEVRIPMIVKYQSKKGPVDSVVSLVDVLPTIIESVGLPPMTNLPGVNIFNVEKLSARTGVLSEVYRVFKERAFSALSGERVITENNDESGLYNIKGLFDLNSDPLEQNLIKNPELQSEIVGYLNEAMSKNQTTIKSVEVPIDEKNLKVLESLGYIND